MAGPSNYAKNRRRSTPSKLQQEHAALKRQLRHAQSRHATREQTEGLQFELAINESLQEAEKSKSAEAEELEAALEASRNDHEGIPE